jgi:tetratricopeptide (TPR) repeat protein
MLRHEEGTRQTKLQLSGDAAIVIMARLTANMVFQNHERFLRKRHAPTSTACNISDTFMTEYTERMDRLAMLNEILAQNPNDAFARYGLAMEYSKAGQVERAMEEFGKLLAANPDYTPGFFMAAQTLARENRIEEAKKMLTDGIASARRTNNGHAQSEMEAMLAELG